MSFFSSLFGRNAAHGAQPRGDWMPFIAAPEGESPVRLVALDVVTRITGLFAETAQTMRFENDNGRDLEGSLSFPLPDGAVVCGYALDVDGVLVDGVVVKRAEARRILEAEERKGVDPGLLEKVQGNVYRTRIYPIPARGARTVRITYVTELDVAGASAGYHLPLGHVQHIDRVNLRVEVTQVPVVPKMSGGVGNLALTDWRPDKGKRGASAPRAWVAEARLPRGVAADDLHIELPDLPDNFTALERDADDAVYLCISERLPDIGTPEAWYPRRLAVAWDASASRTDIGRDLELLDALFDVWSDVVLDVLVFRDRVADAARVFEVRGGASGELFAFLEGLAYDGATALAALDFATTPHPDDEAWLLFCDGMATPGVGGAGLPGLGDVPIYALSSQPRSNAELLEYLAQETDGAYVNLLREGAGKAFDLAVARITRPARAPWRVVEARGVADVHMSQERGRMMVLGRMVEEHASVVLAARGAKGGLGFSMRAADASPGQNLARAWAGLEATRVLFADGEGSAALVELGQRFGLVTPGTSLLVLESLEQYLEYRVEPPRSLPAMRAAYHRELDARGAIEARRVDKQIDDVVRVWRERLAWWDTDFRPRWREVDERVDMKLDAAPAAAPSPEPLGMSMVTPIEYDGSLADAAYDMESAAEADDMPYMSLSAAAPMALSEERAVGGMRDEAPGKPAAKARESAQASIRIKAWEPSTPYLGAMKRVPAEQAYSVYLEERENYRESPSFYLDCGDYLLGAAQREHGLCALSNLLEMGLADPALMRMYAWRLQQAEEFDLAVTVLERVLAEREDEPQSHRDLALALAARWQHQGASSERADDLLRAMELLYHVILHPWERFPEIEIIALMELNRLLSCAERAGIEAPGYIDTRLCAHLPLDVRISMSWDADQTDVDLHVYEPSGEHAYFGNNRTRIGGLVSRDFRNGYGPEEYVLRRAMPGVYTVKAHYYGSSQQELCGPCTVIVHVFSNYARADESVRVLTLRLERPRDQVLVGEIEIAGSDGEDAASAAPGAWRERFAGLARGMSMAEVVALVGQPRSMGGDDELIAEYQPAPGVRVAVVLAPKVEAVYAYVDGARLNLV